MSIRANAGKTLFVLTTLVLAAVSVGGCKPKAGGSCKIEAKEQCTDKAQALVCLGGKWEATQCRGPKGCVQTGSESECDQSVAQEKDVCSVADDHACDADKKRALECKQGKWTAAAVCRGPKGCDRQDNKVDCDNTLALAGDACTKEDDHACSVDGKSSLICKAGKFDTATPCKGPKACSVTPGVVHCDDTVADIGDSCIQKPGREHLACSIDGKQILKCEGGKFVGIDKCRGKDNCKVQPDGVTCG